MLSLDSDFCVVGIAVPLWAASNIFTFISPPFIGSILLPNPLASSTSLEI